MSDAATGAAPAEAPASEPTSTPNTPSSKSTSAGSSGAQKVSIRDFARGKGAQPVAAAEEPAEDFSFDSDEAPEEALDATTEEQLGDTEEAPEIEETEDDYSWAKDIAAFKELHGLPLAEVVKALAEGRLPEQFHDLIKLKLKDGDYEWEDTINGARNGAMQRRKFTQKMQELAKERDAWTSEKNEITGLLHGWQSDKTGKSLLSGLKRMGFPVLEAAKLLAQEYKMLASMDPMAREQYERAQKAEEELEKYRYEQSKSQRQKEASDAEAKVNQRVDWASKTAQTVFSQMGIPVNKGTWGVFLREFDAVTKMNPGADWTDEMVQIAVGAVKEEYEDLRKQMGATGPAKAAVAPKKPVAQSAQQSPARQQLAQAGLGGMRADSAKPAKVGTPGSNRMTPADFRKKFGIRG